MSRIIDNVFAEVCLDERISDGIFRLEEENHMNALRDYFIKRGITKEDAIHVTNRMVEGKFPERQAFNADGILCTFPTPKHKAAAIKRGTHFEENPAPQNTTPPRAEPKKEPVGKKDIAPPEEDEDEDDSGDETPLPKSGGNLFGGSDNPKISQGEKELEIEPPRGDNKPEPIPAPPSVTIAPRTPERVAAEKEVAKQIINTDDTALSKIEPPLSEVCHKQLSELYKKADEMGLKEAVTFLTRFVKI